jgi:minor extracellular serine protease Vpr
MKVKILLLAILASSGVFSQTQSAVSRAGWDRLVQSSERYRQTRMADTEKLQEFPVYRLAGGIYVSVFGKLNTAPDWQYALSQNAIRGSVTGNIATCKIPLESFSSFDFSRIFSYVELPAKACQLLDRAVKDTRADSVQRGLGLPEAFTGRDVFIGVTDWGFDYTHPMFYDTLMQTSRVHAAWDQYKIAGQSPQAFSYGAEYDTPQELLEAGSDTANIYSYHYHGTHVAGIAGGGGAGGNYRGFGFEARYLFATFLIDAASVIDAFNWMKQKADAEQKRLVINMSWGLTYMGTLDGNSILSQAIAELSQQGVVFVASAGNNGDVSYHIKKVFNEDHFQSQINFYSYSPAGNNLGQSITVWGEQEQDFGVSLRIYNTTGGLLAQTPVYHASTQQPYLDSMIIIGQDTIRFNLASEYAHPLNQRPNMRLRVQNRDNAYRVVLYSEAAGGTVHYWNVTELTTGVGNWGMPFTSFGSDGLGGDAKYSIGEPGCSPDVITVGAYASSYINGIGNEAGGTLAAFTSSGPLYTEALKPDISAPGVNVASSVSSFTDQGPSTIAAANVEFNGTIYKFGRLSGTSMSSPCIAGIVSLMLDASPTISPAQVKNILKATARTDEHTGAITAPGHVRWGMGKVNAYAAVVSALETLSVAELAEEKKLIVYPNPASCKVTVLLPENQRVDEIRIISLNGEIVSVPISGNTIDASSLPSGYYVIRASAGGVVFRAAVVLQ